MYEDDQIRAYKASGLTNVKHKEQEKYLDKYMQILHGEWYDKNGNKQLTIEGRTINGCEIAAFYDMAGGAGKASATFRLREDGQEWDVRLSWTINDPPAPEDFIVIGDHKPLHRK